MARADTITILIAAMGGEGGGVLTNWIVAAAESTGLKVQSTSIPGVAQRTGATSYYIEITRLPTDAAPVFCLAPMAGDVDIMLATEFLEAGRAIAQGFVTPDRTLLIASTHRVFSIDERSAMGDGRFDVGRLFRAAAERSETAILFDMAEAARGAGSVLNAVLLGALAGARRLPINAAAFEAAIQADGRAVRANLAGFRAGMSTAERERLTARSSRKTAVSRRDADEVHPRNIMPPARAFAREGVRRLADYQDEAYAALYLKRLMAVQKLERDAGGDGALTREVARHLAVRMSYEDIVRVAEVKVSAERMEQIAAEYDVGDNPHRIVEFFKPGIEEMCAILPPRLARPILAKAKQKGWLNKVYVGMELNTTSISGYLRLWVLTKLRRFRPKSHRFAEEQAQIEAWLDLICRAARIDRDFALEVAELARLIKGYGDTYHRGLANYTQIVGQVVEPVLNGRIPPAFGRDAAASARTAALADPDGKSLANALGEIAAAQTARHAAE
jgi:indolepyruvate ferredoxin oxidoreductase beta subunit